MLSTWTAKEFAILHTESRRVWHTSLWSQVYAAVICDAFQHGKKHNFFNCLDQVPNLDVRIFWRFSKLYPEHTWNSRKWWLMLTQRLVWGLDQKGEVNGLQQLPLL